ncbi:hypothetical protein E2562_037543 [Oryza meyeriana var. granulata]|uniref:Uncharacterized protein n=1 Tax=Oryza meyeriana var. granulata TaxID=110450 RepID=A0A6G1DSY4_9ORYZ|nr:hypothetical protein E2562_037543 [Oryza meyeriana var. granulata]
MESIPIGTSPQLKYLCLVDCLELSSIGGSHALSSILRCPKLQEVKQPFERDLLSMEERDELHSEDAEYIGMIV